eukprot:9574912-Ditylum_brightwellii.AAC.1
MAGLQQDDHSKDQIEEIQEETMEHETLQAKIDEREVHDNVLPPTDESCNPPTSIEDQIAQIEQKSKAAGCGHAYPCVEEASGFT